MRRRTHLKRTLLFLVFLAVALYSTSRFSGVVTKACSHSVQCAELNLTVSATQTLAKAFPDHSSLVKSPYGFIPERKERDSCTNCLPALVVFSLLREDLLALFLVSVDLVVGHVFVVCNFESQEKHAALVSVTRQFSECAEQDTSRCKNPNIRHLHVLSSTVNVGFSGSFNMAIQALLEYRFPYVVFNNDDTRFIAGRLLAAKKVMETTQACMYFLEGFSSFGISLQGVATLGPMDENFWPAYGEDCDYWYRAQLKNCTLFYRGGVVPDQSTALGNENAFVAHGDSEHSSSSTYKSSSTLGKLVANTLDEKRGRFAYLIRKWGFNSCDLYHEVINALRNEDEVLQAMSEIELKARGVKSMRPYGLFQDVNSWLKDDWLKEHAVSPRAANSQWAPKEIVWRDSDDIKLENLVESLNAQQGERASDEYVSTVNPPGKKQALYDFYSREKHLIDAYSAETEMRDIALVPSTMEKVNLATHTQVHIPVVIVPVLSETNLISRCLRSIDVPVSIIILIFNSNIVDFSDEGRKTLVDLSEEIDALSTDFAETLVVIRTRENMGYGRSMNLGMKLSPWAEWWLCTSADVEFPPSSMQSVLPTIDREARSGAMLFMLGIHFSAVVLTQHLVQKVGYFDENLWPAYVEDCDLMLRVRMAAVGLEFDVDSISDVDWEVPGHYRYLQPKPSLLHVGQRGSTGSIGQQIARAHENNKKYYQKKWGVSSKQWNHGRGIFSHGCGIPMKGQFQSPFNVSGNSRWEDLPFIQAHLEAQRLIFSS
mmetsp:Transcript_8472/g.35409  ORF Transcript_8472/g.35409 Transcript_8472/m.35409 type:complete len:769 (+) Transcript_8472:266-2572(+)